MDKEKKRMREYIKTLQYHTESVNLADFGTFSITSKHTGTLLKTFQIAKKEAFYFTLYKFTLAPVLISLVQFTQVNQLPNCVNSQFLFIFGLEQTVPQNCTALDGMSNMEGSNCWPLNGEPSASQPFFNISCTFCGDKDKYFFFNSTYCMLPLFSETI